MLSSDLTECDREPIHIPGAIQPHGVLLVAHPASGEILQVAGDAAGLLGQDGPVLGLRLDQLLDGRLKPLLDRSTAPPQPGAPGPAEPAARRGSKPSYLGAVTPAAGGGEIDVLFHERDGMLVLELEGAPRVRPAAAEILGSLRATATALEGAPDLLRTCQIAAVAFRRLTGFDRVMIYRFLPDGAGSVFAEDKAEALPPLLNHHYPASDIPQQARELYVRSVIRLIPDAGYTPAPLVPELCPATGRSLDMSECSLRSVSPIHLQYLKNMGVAASMSVSILRNGALWGLVACHHTAPRPLSYELREACRHIGQILSQQVAAREQVDAYAQTLRLAEMRQELLLALGRAGAIEGALADHAAELRAILPSDGVAICSRGQLIAASGTQPPDGEIEDLAAWALAEGRSDPFATDRLAERYPPAADFRAVASGLLATAITGEDRLVLLWFRAEQVEVVNWAGNPHKAVEPGDAGILTPRASFALWQEAVHGRSRPWTAAETDAARRFRDAIVEFLRQRRLGELNRQLMQTLADKDLLVAQKDLLMREVHHRVQNSLQLVNSMLGMQEREAGDSDVAIHLAEARRRILAISTVHRRLWRSDEVLHVRFDTYLRELRDGLVEEWGGLWDEHVRMSETPILVPTDRAIILALVVTELLTNAVKHAYHGAAGPIDITVGAGADASIRVTIADQGSGLTRRERPGGFGAHMTASLIANIGGQIVVSDNRPGTCVTVTVPLEAAAAPPGPEDDPTAS